MQPIVWERKRCVAGTDVADRSRKQRRNAEFGVVGLRKVVDKPFDNSMSGVPLDVQQDVVPVVPLKRRATDPHRVRGTALAAHDAQSYSYSARSNNTVSDG